MKNLYKIIIVSVLLYSCESATKFKTSFIINDEEKKLILDGVEREVVNWKKEFITFFGIVS